MHRYAHSTILKMCIAAIRQSEGFDTDTFKVPLSDTTLQLARKLKAASKSPTTHSALIHALCHSIVGVFTPEMSANKWKNPVEIILALDSLKKGPQFRNEHEITPVLAHWEYALRAIGLYECFRVLGETPEGNIDE